MALEPKGHILITSPTGALRSLPPTAEGPPSWSEELYGGYAEFNLPLNAAVGDLPLITYGDRVEFWANGIRLYRGYINDREPQEADPSKILLSGFGRMFDLSLITCTAPIVRDSTADLTDIFNDIVLLWVDDVFDSSVMAVSTVLSGVNVSSFDPTGKTVKQAFDDLCDLSGGTVCWGVGVDAGTGKDLLYLRLIGDTTHVVSIPGRDASSTGGGVKTSEIKNALELTGGDMERWRQNLLPNADFERLTPSGDSDNNGLVFGNLLVNPGFEIGSTHDGWTSSGWTRTGTAHVFTKQNGLPGSNAIVDPDAYSGTWSIEISDSAEEANQVVSGVVAGHKYGIRAHICPSDHFTAGTAHVLVEWFDVGLSRIRQDDLEMIVDSQIYQRFENAFIAPALSDSCEIRLVVASGGSSLMFDAISFWDADEPVQKGWFADLVGTATVDMDWNATGAKHGVYCIKATVAGSDNSGSNEVIIRPTARFPVVPGDRYSFYTWLKTSGISAHDGAFRMKFYDSSDTLLLTFTYSFTGSGLPSWTFGYVFGTAKVVDSTTHILWIDIPSDALPSYMTVEVALQADGDWYMDACTLMNDRGILELFDGEDSTHAPGDGTVAYLRDGPLFITFNAEDLITALDDAEANDSWNLYRRRTATETVDSIVSYPAAKRFARPYLLSRAKKSFRPVVTIVGAERNLHTGDNARLLGDSGATLSGGDDLPIARIRGSIDGSGPVTQSTESGKGQLTVPSLIRQAAKEELARKR